MQQFKSAKEVWETMPDGVKQYTLEQQQAASVKRMELFASMPEDLQELSRQHGGIVDQMYAVGWDKPMILAALERRGKLS